LDLHTRFDGFYKFIPESEIARYRNYCKVLDELCSRTSDLRIAQPSPCLDQHAPASRSNLVRGEKRKGAGFIKG
jgi:hypothetical protein